MFGSKIIRRACAVVGLAVALAGVGTVAATAASAAPAQCPVSDNCSGTVPATLTIGESLTLTINAPAALSFSGQPGAASVASVGYNVLSNDKAGYALTAAASNANMTDGSGDSFPVSDITVMGPAQITTGCSAQWSGQCWAPVPVSTTALTTMASGAISATAGDNGTDYYGFWTPAASGGAFTNGYTGSGIPNEPAGTFSDSVLYLLLPN